VSSGDWPAPSRVVQCLRRQHRDEDAEEAIDDPAHGAGALDRGRVGVEADAVTGGAGCRVGGAWAALVI